MAALWGRLFWSSSTTQVITSSDQINGTQTLNTEVMEITQSGEATVAYSPGAIEDAAEEQQSVPFPKAATTVEDTVSPELPVSPAPKRFSLKRLSFSSRRSAVDEKPALSTVQEHSREYAAQEAAHKEAKREKVSKADARAKKTALRVRMLITGEPTGSTPAVSPVVAKSQQNKIKAQLSEPKTANKLIQELRRLPATTAASAGGSVHECPIHAVCLPHTDAEEDSLHFSKLQSVDSGVTLTSNVDEKGLSTAAISTAPIEQFSALLAQMHVIELVKAPDLGLGQPGDGPGLLAGAVPTPETVLRGVKEITPQLMALGYATGRSIMPDHTGIYPPTDRMSVLTYWWGLEVVMPPPTIQYLAGVQSVTNAVVNFLSTMALVNGGVREILPFIRYIAQYIDFEFNSIKAQNKGKGVICAATWIMPAAMVPRPWDFPDPPPEEESQEESEQTGPLSPLPTTPIKQHPKNLSTAPTLPKPRPVSSILDLVSKPGSSPQDPNNIVKTSSSAPPTPPPATTLSVQA